MTAQVVRHAAALIIGNELLSGKVQEANLLALARTLRAVGIRLRRAVIVQDDVDGVAQEVRTLSTTCDVVFTSGGVGPTHDDVTMQSVARAFDCEVIADPRLTAQIQHAYAEKTTESHLRMARVPEGSELVSTPEVTWPTPVKHNVWILPGVPELFRMKLAVVRQLLKGPEAFFSRAAFVRLDEPEITPILDAVAAGFPQVEVGSYPKWFDPTYRTQVTFDGQDQAQVEAALDALLQALPAQALLRVD